MVGRLKCDARVGASAFRLQTLAFFAVLALDELVAERLHFHGDGFDLLAVVATEGEGGNGDEQNDQGGGEDEGDAFSEAGGLGQPGLADVAEKGHHAGYGPYQSEQRRDADDDLQDDQAPLP